MVLNYDVPEEVLLPYLPDGTELDDFQGRHLISVVAFKFENTRLFGILPVPGASDFNEVNLRFYVRRRVAGEVRRGVVFVREVVPSALMVWGARTFFEEPYEKSAVQVAETPTEGGRNLRYSWGPGTDPCSVQARVEGEPQALQPDSLEEFILEHYWGYNQSVSGKLHEYSVDHPPWLSLKVQHFEAATNLPDYYPARFAEALRQSPSSVIYATGSEVSVSPSSRSRVPLSPGRPLGWVLYDAACGFCTWWIPLWEKTINSTGYAIVPLQVPWVAANVQLQEGAELNNDIRLLLRDGRLLHGADAYIFGMRRVWWARPLGYLFGLPGFRQLMWLFYKCFNRNRFLISKACRMPPTMDSSLTEERWPAPEYMRSSARGLQSRSKPGTAKNQL